MSELFADPRPLPADYWQDVAPVVPVTTRSRVRTDVGPGHYTLFPGPTAKEPRALSAEDVRMRELWRMHAAPHLYDQWQIDLAMDLHTQAVEAAGKVSWFCDTCHTTIVADTFADTCH